MNIGEKIDSQVQAYIKHLRENGAPVNTAIVIAVAKGILIEDTSMPCADTMSYLTKKIGKIPHATYGTGKKKGKYEG